MPRDISVLGVPINTYTLLISLAIVLSAWIVVRGGRSSVSPSRMINLCLAMLISGLVLARIEHIILNWDYFSRQVSDVLQWVFPQRGESGLGWHGAVIGALGVYFAYRLPHKAQLLNMFAIPLGLIALAAWVGCASQGCAYGAEVDTLARYSPLTVAETRDLYGILAPRYNTQLFGAGVGLVCLIAAVVLRRSDKTNLTAKDAENAEYSVWRFWVVLMLLSIGIFLIGFWRGDAAPRWFDLRGDQVFDMVLFGWAVVMLFYDRLRTRSE